MASEVLKAAKEYIQAGLSVLPVLTDGSKRPARPWKDLQQKQLDDHELGGAFGGDVGIAIVCGSISGDLQVLDFDRPGIFEKWAEAVERQWSGCIDLFPHVRTPSGGDHLYFRSAPAHGNLKLAEEPAGDNGKAVLIETRGEGGYVLAPPSPGSCHQTGGRYVHVGGPPLTGPPTISKVEAALLFDTARKFGVAVPISEATEPRKEPRDEGRPGDDFNRRADWITDVMGPAGWEVVGRRGDVVDLKRPGKEGRGSSATINFGGSDLLCVFSTNGFPFETNRGYSKFSAYALLYHNGDHKAAARGLRARGYGQEDLPEDYHFRKAQRENSLLKIYSSPEAFAEWEKATDDVTIPTGIESLDDALGGGLPVNHITTLSGYTGVGKSEIARQIGRTAAIAGYGVLRVDVELGLRVLLDREFAQESGIPYSAIRKRKNLTEDQKEALGVAQRAVNPRPIFYLPTVSGVKLKDLGEAIEASLERFPSGPKLVVFDSSQRLSWGADEATTRDRLTAWMHFVESFAKQNNVAVLCLSEQRRDPKGGVPKASDILTSGAESRAIEFQSAVLIGAWEEEEFEETVSGNADTYAEKRVKLKIAKNRYGGTATIGEDLVFIKPCWAMRTERVRDVRIKRVRAHIHNNLKAGTTKDEAAKFLNIRRADAATLIDWLVESGEAEKRGKRYFPKSFPGFSS